MKRGSIELSFGTIFAVILMIAFVAISAYVIVKFLDTANCAKIGTFVQDVDEETNRVWISQKASTSFEGSLPSSIDYVCFARTDKAVVYTDMNAEERMNAEKILISISDIAQNNMNMFLYPIKNSCSAQLGQRNVLHLNLNNTANPLCFKNIDGKVSFRIEKNFGENFITIKKN